MIIVDERLWAGPQSNYMAVLDAQTAIMGAIAAGKSVDEEDEDEDGSYLLSVDSGVGVIEIAGSLVNSNSPWLQYFGMTGYPEIRAAMIEAAENPDVKEILLDIKSGGGAVSGVDDTAQLIRHINDNIKPVTAFAENAASAAYWLGSSAGRVVAGKTSLVGSIGVIATHMEYSEQLKADGIGVTVVRAGSEKARANSVEKLNAKGEEQISQAVHATYEVFVNHVADMRGKSYEYTDKQMADGKEFIGQAALDVGLVDAISTYDAVISDLKEKALASSNKTMQNQRKGGITSPIGAKSCSGDNIMARKTLNEQEALAASLGVDLTAETEISAQTDTDTDTDAVEANTETAETGTGVPVATATQSAVDVLAAQLKDKDSELLQSKIEVAKLQDRLADLEASSGPMREIVSKSINTMQVALGGSAASHDGMDAKLLVAEHARVAASFTASFKVGGVSASASASEAVGATKATTVDPRHIARVNAARFNHK